MFLDIITLFAGLVLIIAGGNYLTDGAEAIAHKFKISSLVIGMTVVAFGSSAPDFVVCLMSTLSGKSQMAIGDVVGANIFDLLLVVGIMAMVTRIPVSQGMAKGQLPLLFLASAALFFCGDDKLIDGAKVDVISRTDGLMLLILFSIFMTLTFYMAKMPASAPQPVPENKLSSAPTKWDIAVNRWYSFLGHVFRKRINPIALKREHIPEVLKGGYSNIIVSVAAVIGGLGALVVGGNWIVDGASGIALKAGMSEALVGLTIVAFGSSVPDLTTSVIAAMKGQTGIALGNVVGACIFNIYFIIGFCSAIKPLQAGSINIVDFSVLMGASLLLWIFGAWTKSKIIGRWEGLFLALAYCGYMAYLIACK